MQSEKHAYPIGDLPKLVGIGRSTLYSEIASGRLVARKVGSRTVILATDLEAYLKSLPEIASKPSAGELA